MTSNLGADHLLKDVKKDDVTISQATKEKVFAEVKRHFRPEFLNRLDDMVVFNPLSKADLRKIINLQLEDLSKRLEERDITLKLTSEGIEAILTGGYNPVYGARPLKRFLEKHVGTSLSRLLVSQELPNHAIVHISADSNGELTFKTELLENASPRKGRSKSPTPSTTKAKQGPIVEEIDDDDMDE
uniref:Clp ATPase C-terminal domain-containing protein n=1 Tax=Arcella intermedia TaxID=1963864 RepID=A0A6B2LJY9_9EUKA